jgi:hypothetical protein
VAEVLWCWMDMQGNECSGLPEFTCVDRTVPVGMRHPRLVRRRALCGLCVSRTGMSPSVCGRRTRAELHIQDIGPRMLPTSAALGQGASCRHPCCSFPCRALGAHGTLHRPLRGKHLCALCTTYLGGCQILTHRQRSETTRALSQGSASC